MTKVADIRGLPSLNDGETRLLEQLIEGLGRDALIGLSGYLADLARQASSTEVAAVLPDTPAPLVTVLYGSQTGHAEHLAADLVARIRAAGLSVRLCAADEYPRRELRDEQLLLVIISTQGDGDPPDNARELLDFLNGRRAPQLESLRYAVLALGDFELSPVLRCRAAGRWEAGRARGAANASLSQRPTWTSRRSLPRGPPRFSNRPGSCSGALPPR